MLQQGRAGPEGGGRADKGVGGGAGRGRVGLARRQIGADGTRVDGQGRDRVGRGWARLAGESGSGGADRGSQGMVGPMGGGRAEMARVKSGSDISVIKS